jgi:hypothetical protein
MRFPAALLLLPTLLLSSCIAVAAGATAGFLIHREVREGVHSATVTLDAERTFRGAEECLRSMSSDKVLVQTSPRIVRGEVDGADVSIEVQAYDLDRTVILVEAQKDFGRADPVAERVLNALLDRLH